LAIRQFKVRSNLSTKLYYNWSSFKLAQNSKARIDFKPNYFIKAVEFNSKELSSIGWLANNLELLRTKTLIIAKISNRLPLVIPNIKILDFSIIIDSFKHFKEF
jgi:hypothetical protein